MSGLQIHRGATEITEEERRESQKRFLSAVFSPLLRASAGNAAPAI
jgi:hypothetical protein